MEGPEPIERRSGRAIVVRGDDIDTDRIIPARFMKSVTFESIGEHAFEDARFTSDGTPKAHPFNEARFEAAEILVVNRNFGCGSSREHAPRALADWGIRGLIGESFAEIFFGNCVAMGIPAVVADHDAVAALMDSVELDPSQPVTIDLSTLRVTSRAGSIPVRMPEGARRQLVDGSWDAMRTLLGVRDEILEKAARLPYVRGFGP
ncbi:MAG: 3-isopropylmalate dehydratase small subunit [Myxococcota bacterium]